MAWLMFWHGQYFVAVNGLTLLMFWHSRCFGTFDIIEPLMFWCSRTNAGERQSLRDLKYQPHLYTDCTKTLTAPKHRPHRNTDNAGPKGQLVKKYWYLDDDSDVACKELASGMWYMLRTKGVGVWNMIHASYRKKSSFCYLIKCHYECINKLNTQL